MEGKLFIFAAVAISEVFSACAPSEVEFSNFWISPKRRIPFSIGASAKKCPGLNEFYYIWVVEEYPKLQTVLYTRLQSLTVDGYSFDSDRVFKTKYRVTATLSHYPDMSFPDSESGIFEFTPDEMHIEIVGGLRKGHSISKDLIVDARRLSRDTSYPPNEDAFAGNYVKWVVDPEIKGYELSNNLVLTIPKELLKVNELYEFTVTVKRTKIPKYVDEKIVSQTVLILPFSAPEINIKCISNCIMPNNLVPTAFGIECTKNCEGLHYMWKIEPLPPPGTVQFGDGFDKILINDKAFQEGDKIYVSFLEGLFPHMTSVTYSSGIKVGNCSINPQEGISGITKFKLKCEGFSSPYGLSLCMVFQTDGYSPVNVLLNEFSYSEESDLFIAPGDPAEILIYVEDHAFLSRMVRVNVTVQQFLPEKTVPMLSAIKEFVIEEEFTSISSYALEGLHDEVVQLISSMVDAIQYYDLDEATAKDLHKHMVEALMLSPTVRVTSALQNMWILWKIQNYRIETDSITARLIGETLLNTVLDVHDLYVHKQSVLFPQYYIDMLNRYTLLLCADLILPSHETEDVLLEIISPHDYDSYDELVSRKIQIRDDYRTMTTDVIVIIQTNSLSILHQIIPGTKPSLFESDSIFILSQRLNLRNFSDGIISLNDHTDQTNTTVYVPFEIVENLLKKTNYVDYQFAIFFMNPFWWDTNILNLNTRVTLFEFFIQCDRIQEFSTPFLITLDVIEIPFVEKIGLLSSTEVNAYRVELEPNVTLVIEFYNDGEHPNDYLVTWADCFCTENDFLSERSQIIKRGADNESNTMRVQNGNDKKIIYHCIKKLTPVLSYRFQMATVSCMHWDLADEEWKKEGCRPVFPTLDMETLICECYHSSLFVGEIITPNNRLIVNLKIDFAIDFVKNYVMVFFIFALLFLWLVFLLLAHLRDRSVKNKNVIHKLDDNVPGDSNPYLVVIFTGFFYDAQTTADVAFQIVGNQSQSRTHLIKCHGVTLLKRNSQDWFIIYSPDYLGEIKKIKIWHNCKGSYPHWYCDRIIVQDLKVGEQYCFTVKKWFSVIWGSGKIYREIRLKKASKKMREILFRTHFERDIKDKHIWMSVLTRDFQSNFNSKERVSTGFCFLFLSMLANALLLSVPHDAPSDSIDQQNDFRIALSNIMVFIGAWIVATPFSFLIFFIFKNSAPL